MTLKLTSTANELWKGWNLAWFHNFTHIACAKKLRRLREKQDALRLPTGQSRSKYQGFGRKLIYYKGISSFLTYLKSRLFLHSICTIQSHIINFQPFSDLICIFFLAFHVLFWAKMTLNLKSTANELWKGWNLAWCYNFTHITCAKKLSGLREKMDALHVQTGQSRSKYEGFGRKLIYYKGISYF